ncbi:PH (Pleckstrin Homology) domain-containing protein [Nonomuraea polychroma]|uniref:PH (Pleckstrin Homology) domain-containing protein n=1 Tax=Nonomuraea polychroma TaxID=46176 RepID=A0A438M9C3_9ACTN|nr:PH domain-containing protein [Nonomuraea polychroma]RVX42309.1 PH (Pleckstrin Homology) domain-containing protein [Nonomuraea polychroma]
MWRVRREQAVLKILGALVCAGLAVYWWAEGDLRGVILAVPAAVLVGAMGLRDVLAPVRLAADESGITVVHGFAGKRHVPWEAIWDIKVDVRRRWGIRSEMLEIDTGDYLHIFSPHDLGASPTEVAAVLRRRGT